MDLSINQTLSRTIITSGTVLMVVLPLFIFGGEVINTFAFVLLVGLFVGMLLDGVHRLADGAVDQPAARGAPGEAAGQGSQITL